MSWEEEYKRKLISAEDAANMVKSGDKIVIGSLPEPHDILFALSGRKDELKNVELNMYSVQVNAGWYDPGWSDSFKLNMEYVSAVTRPRLDDKTADFTPTGFALEFKGHRDNRPDRRQFDFLLTSVTPPNKYGICGFGHGMWDKKEIIQRKFAKKIIVEVDNRLIRTYGNNWIPVSDIDYFVESSVTDPIIPLQAMAPEPDMDTCVQYVASLINDGDTIQTGFGGTTYYMVSSGALDNKHDLGMHTEFTPTGMVELIKKGVLNGKRKNIHKGVVVTTTVWPDAETLEFAKENPLVELHSMSYTNNPLVIAQNDNMVAINQAISIDLTGQVTACSIGPRIYSATGGQLEFTIGAMLSKGGKAITILRSTARKGAISTILPTLEPGTHVSVPNTLVDYVVTEYGIARLHRKTLRERANELIAVAHPNFRAELKKEAQKMFGA